MPVNCEYSKNVPAYFSGELKDEDIKEHIKNCSKCQEYLKFLERLYPQKINKKEL